MTLKYIAIFVQSAFLFQEKNMITKSYHNLTSNNIPGISNFLSVCFRSNKCTRCMQGYRYSIVEQLAHAISVETKKTL